MSFLPSVFCSALGSGMVLSVFTAPFSFCKVRKASPNPSLAAPPLMCPPQVQQQVSSNKSLLRCAGDAYGLGGIRTFYRGYPTLLCCEALGRAVYMGTYESCRFVDKTSLPVQIASAGTPCRLIIYSCTAAKITCESTLLSQRGQVSSLGPSYTPST